MRYALLLGLSLALALATAPVRADPLDACIADADAGQSLRDHGKLLAARDRFVACSALMCPKVVRADCTAWLAAVDARLPSLVLTAVGGDGQALDEVWVSIDDGPPEPVSGNARERKIDPGSHTLHFFARGPSGIVTLKETLVVREGDRARPHVARLGQAEAALSPTGPRAEGSLVAPILLGSVALVGGILFAGFASDAKSSADSLRATCAPHCSSSEVDAVRAKEIGANVALGVGVASAVAALVLVIKRNVSPSHDARREPLNVVHF